VLCARLVLCALLKVRPGRVRRPKPDAAISCQLADLNTTAPCKIGHRLVNATADIVAEGPGENSVPYLEFEITPIMDITEGVPSSKHMLTELGCQGRL